MNGITKDKEGHIFIGSSKSGQIYVADQQADNSLVITDVIKVGRSSGLILMQAWKKLTLGHLQIGR